MKKWTQQYEGYVCSKTACSYISVYLHIWFPFHHKPPQLDFQWIQHLPGKLWPWMSGGLLLLLTFFHPPSGPVHLIKMTYSEETNASTVSKGETFEFSQTKAKQTLLTSTNFLGNHPLAIEETKTRLTRQKKRHTFKSTVIGLFSISCSPSEVLSNQQSDEVRISQSAVCRPMVWA